MLRLWRMVSCRLQVLQKREDMGVRLTVQRRGKEGGVARAVL
jgi:hypothetical protein